jgi:hypothetical protein
MVVKAIREKALVSFLTVDPGTETECWEVGNRDQRGILNWKRQAAERVGISGLETADKAELN